MEDKDYGKTLNLPKTSFQMKANKFYSTLNQGTEIKITLNIFKEEQ